jgi:hypothetical protein
MKYIKFTFIDKITGISALKEKSFNELELPNIEGLTVEWTDTNTNSIPILYGTCPQSSTTNVEGFLEELTEQMWNTRKEIYTVNLFSCPKTVENKHFRLTLLRNNLLDNFETTVKTLPKELQIEWEYSINIDRTSKLILETSKILNLFEINPETEYSKIDMLFNESAR